MLGHMREEACLQVPDAAHALSAEASGAIPDDFVIERTGVQTRQRGELRDVLADERRTAWTALRYGLAYNWRGVGDTYRDRMLEGLADGSIKCVVTTSTLATGVNVRGVDHVCVRARRDMPDHELTQMTGRAARFGPGVALVYGQQPNMNRQQADSLHAVGWLPDAQVAIFVWMLLRMTPSLAQAEEGRAGQSTLMVLDDWITMALPAAIIGIMEPVDGDRLRDVFGLLKGTCEILTLYKECPVTRASSAVLSIVADDGEMVMGACHIVHQIENGGWPECCRHVCVWDPPCSTGRPAGTGSRACITRQQGCRREALHGIPASSETSGWRRAPSSHTCGTRSRARACSGRPSRGCRRTS
jgi:hypothetical protein